MSIDAPSRRDALSFEAALAAVRDLAPTLGIERVPAAAAAGRLLAEDVVAQLDHPQFDNSAMDGFALRAADAPGELAIVGESRAGAPWAGRLAAGQAVRVSTGAELPAGADAVVAIEQVTVGDDGAVGVPGAVAAGGHVRRRGEDVRRGDVLLAAGRPLRAHEVIVPLGAGQPDVACRRRPRVAVLATGDELVEAGRPLAEGQIYDSNRPGVAAQAASAGAVVMAGRHVPDERGAVIAALRELLTGDATGPPDLLVTIGGVSVGAHDHLRPALREAGVEQVFWGAEIKPGGPLWLGRRGAQVVLGLPGNPVSAAVCFHLFGRELLGVVEPWHRTAPLAEEYVATTTRTEFIRCRWRANALAPLPRQGSHAITSLAAADALALIPAGVARVPAGSPVWFSELG